MTEPLPTSTLPVTCTFAFVATWSFRIAPSATTRLPLIVTEPPANVQLPVTVKPLYVPAAIARPEHVPAPGGAAVAADPTTPTVSRMHAPSKIHSLIALPL